MCENFISKTVRRQLLYACLAGFCPLMCCFCPKLLYVYQIGKLCDVTFKTIIAKFNEKIKVALQ